MKAATQLGRLAWPEGRLLEAMAAAAGGSALAGVPVEAGAAGWGAAGGEGGGGAPRLADGDGLLGAGEGRAITGAQETLDDFAEACGVEVDAVEIGWEELERSLPRLGPAVLRLPAGGGLLVVLRGRGRSVALLTPAGRRHRVSAGQVRRALRRPAERSLAAGVEPLVDGLSLKARWRRRAGEGLIAAHLGAGPGCTAYLLGGGGGVRASRLGAGRGPQGADDGGSGRRPVELGAGGLGFPAGALLAAVGGGQALFLGGWYLLGGGLVAGQLDRGRLLAWSLLMLILPLARMAELTAAATLGHRGVLLLRRRLAASVLALAPATVRGEGTGGLLGRLLAAESIERLLLTAVPGLLLAAAELAGAAVALAHGIAAAALLALLVAVLGVEGGLGWRYGDTQRRCAASRLALTGRLVEGLSGHRTRLAQRGAGPDPLDDRGLAGFHAMVRRMDNVGGLLRAALPRAWLCAGLAVMAVSLGQGGRATGVGATAGLAASLGGLLLAQGGLGRLAAAVCDLAAARTAGGELGPLLGTAPSRRAPPRPARPAGAGAAAVVLEARELAYRTSGRPRPLLAGAAVTIRRGDRLVLDGASGSGKSTLAGLLAGQAVADSGLLLLDGLDLATIGTRSWRRRVVAVPQLHANHLFADTLAFNLLLGRGWPPSARDLGEAEGVCRDLGLGDLLDRLPAGLEQRIGEAGWQLSEGEASRVCLARALLQDPELLILDESLAALDPETRLLALDVAARRARTLMVIAHAAPD